MRNATRSISHFPYEEQERLLRPQYGLVLRALYESAVADPEKYLTMREIAERGWQPARRPQDPQQVKNNVQRAVYEIRMKLGHDIVLNDGATYRLNLSRLKSVAHGKSESVTSQPATLPGSFEVQVRDLLRDAVEAKDLRQLTFWGNRAAVALRSNSDELLEAALCGKQVRVVCSEGCLAADIVAQMVWKYAQPLSEFLECLRGWVELCVLALPIGEGAAWVDWREGQSRVAVAGAVGELTDIARGLAAESYIAPLDARLAMMRAQVAGRPPLIVVDRFDLTLSGQEEVIWGYFKSLVDAAGETGPTNVISSVGKTGSAGDPR